MTPEKYNPAYDNKIYHKFSQKTIANKAKNKELFCEEINLQYDRKIPIACITYALTDENNLNIIEDIMNGLLEQNIQIIVTSIGNEKYQKYFTGLASQNSSINIIQNDEISRRKLYAASDLFICSSETTDCLNEAKTAMKYGAIPVITQQSFIKDYNPNAEIGNAFVYKKNSPWSLFANIIRALESFRFPFDWQNIQKSAMENEGNF